MWHATSNQNRIDRRCDRFGIEHLRVRFFRFLRTAIVVTMTRVVFYAGGVGTALCFGVIGELIAAGAGAGAGYLATSEQVLTSPSNNAIG